MALTPREPKGKETSQPQVYRKIPWVTWFAIILGVGMTAIGIILLLWGLAWQGDVGEPQNINGDDLQGGPCLIPMGGAMAVIGILWVLTGYRGFKKDQNREEMQSCPNCRKMIEADLNFCYYCNTTFDEEDEEEEKERPPSKRREKREEKEEKGGSKKARPFSPEER